MNFEQLKKLFPTATKDTWHQHPDGGGWVENTASVDETAYIGPNAQVYMNAWVSENVQVCESAQVFCSAEVSENAGVFGNARIFENAQVHGYAQVYGNAQVSGYTHMYGNAHVFGNAKVYGHAQVYGGKWKVSPLYIQGTEHSVCICKPGVIRIGCEEHSIDEWLENYRAIGEKNKYSSDEIEEYGGYIKFINERRNQPNICGK